MSGRTSRATALKLVRAIRKVADCPCPKHQALFLRHLQRVDQLVCKVGNPTIPGDGAFLEAGQAEANGYEAWRVGSRREVRFRSQSCRPSVAYMRQVRLQ